MAFALALTGYAAPAAHPLVNEGLRAIEAGDFSAAVQLLRQPALAEDADAMLLLGVLHDCGGGVARDSLAALRLWQRAAWLGQKDAARLLHPRLPNRWSREWWRRRTETLAEPAIRLPERWTEAERGGLVVRHDLALRWIQRRSAEGDPVGLFNAHQLARFGARSPEAKARVRTLLERAAALDFVPALLELSSLLDPRSPGGDIHQLGFIADEERSRVLLARAAALGDAHAQLLWGHELRSRHREDRDPAAAVVQYRLAAAQGNGYAHYFLAEAHRQGNGAEREAAHWRTHLRAAAEADCDSAVSTYAPLLYYGRGFPADPAAAIAMAERSLAVSLVHDENLLALVAYAYTSGVGAPKDDRLALWWTEWAAEAGSAHALTMLATRKIAEAGNDRDSPPAREGFRMMLDAAEKKSGFGMFCTGLMLIQGIGTTVDVAEAEKWLRRAEINDVQVRTAARFHRAVLRLAGTPGGPAFDPDEAVRLLQQGAEDGDRDSRWLLAVVEFERAPDAARLAVLREVTESPAEFSYLAEFTPFGTEELRQQTLAQAESHWLEILAASAEPAVVPEAADRAAPRLLRTVVPFYPTVCRRLEIEGEVTLEFILTPEGRCGEIQVHGEANPALAAAAISAVRQWRFTPALRDGRPVPVRVRQAFPFSLRVAVPAFGDR